ncbi:MAG TPA: hypothetical protein VKV17_09580 [Bryobacteraceae bacterium]|nr:hypothetical protein [Bryobacteraceae bacterium]
MGKRDPLKRTAPSRAAEAILAILLPPACREEVLGDLHERYVAPAQYACEALRTAPWVILSRIRRTADPQVLLMHAFALYVAFAGAARAADRGFLGGEGGLLHLAVPVVAVLLGIVLEDAYAKPGRRAALMLSRGPAVGIAFALFVQTCFRFSWPVAAIPFRIFLDGSGMSLLLCSAIRLLFPPVANQVQGAAVPAFWLKQTGGTIGYRAILVLQSIAALVAIALTATWLSGASGVSLPRVLSILTLSGLFLLIGYQVSKRV